MEKYIGMDVHATSCTAAVVNAQRRARVLARVNAPNVPFAPCDQSRLLPAERRDATSAPLVTEEEVTSSISHPRPRAGDVSSVAVIIVSRRATACNDEAATSCARGLRSRMRFFRTRRSRLRAA